MTSHRIDFIRGLPENSRNKKEQDLSLCYAYPTLSDDQESSIFINDNKSVQREKDNDSLSEDGLYSSDNLLIQNSVRPFILNNIKTLEYERRNKLCGKLFEIAVRRVTMLSSRDESRSTIEICAVSILFRKTIVCRCNSPFNRKLCRLLIRNSESNNLSIQVHTESGQSIILPLPLPKRCIKDYAVDIDFAITDNLGKIHAGIVTCTISMSNYGCNMSEDQSSYSYKLSNDPNDPQNSLSLLKPQFPKKNSEVKHFILEDPALKFNIDSSSIKSLKSVKEETKLPDIVVTEEPAFSLLDVSFRNIFQARRPLRPSSSTRRHHTIGKTVLSITILRGVEIPVREESALVQPFVEVEWCNTVHSTTVSDGPAPIWQQTMNFELPRQNGEYCVKLRLYDQHPVWGQQWLGEARIPLEYHRNYQELERWVDLSPLFSPVLLFGYVQASPGHAHTRIYVLMKMEQPGNAKSLEISTINTLLKGIQRALDTPYKIMGLDNPDQAARLAMLLLPLPVHYGPIAPRQALKIKKVDHYGRACLLSTLLQGFDMEAYILLGSSQTCKWSAFILTIGENGTYLLWDPESGHCYRLDDNRCSLMKVYRLINHFGIWENLQKSILPHNLKYDIKSSKDWRQLDNAVQSGSKRIPQTIDLNVTEDEVNQIKGIEIEVEQYLKESLTSWRSADGFTTVFNRHAVSVLRNFVMKSEDFPKRQLDKRDLKQLYRAYHTHGFLLNTRQFSSEELSELINATKVHKVTGPIEFALVCHIQRYVGKICSVWLGILVLRSRD